MSTGQQGLAYHLSRRKLSVLSPTRKSNKHRDQVCVLDLGSHDLRAAIFDCGIDGQSLEVRGLVRRRSRGIGAGAVIDLHALASEVQALLEQLELMSDIRVNRVVLMVTHPSLALDAASGVASVSGHLVQPRDCRRAEDVARDRFDRRRQRLVHEAIKNYRLDGRLYRERPHALKGQRLEVEVQHVSVCEATLDNLVRAVRHAKVQVEAVCSNVLAAAHGALTMEEKTAGVAFLEIGGETTTSAVFAGGALVTARTERGGSRELTKALSQGLLVPQRFSEDVKQRYGSACRERVAQGELVHVETIGLREPRHLCPRLFAEAMEPALCDLLQRIAALVAQSGLANQLSAGLVLAGNGARLNHLSELAEQTLSVPVRVATPRKQEGLGGLLNQPGDCALIGAARLWSQDQLPSWEAPSRRARARRNAQPRWLDLLA